MTADRLGIWLEGVLAVVEQDRRRLRLEYTPAALRAFPGGTPLLSLQFPVSNARFPNGVTRAFLDGLLPEGDGRLILAQEFSLRADDTFGLIRVLGRDCAGALVIQPEGEPPPPPPTVLAAEPLTDDALVALVANLRSAPLGVDERVRISLAGVQEKLALTLLPGGGWGRPSRRRPVEAPPQAGDCRVSPNRRERGVLYEACAPPRGCRSLTSRRPGLRDGR